MAKWPWRKAEAELDREVQYHLEALADAYERQGMTKKDAMRRARAEFGGSVEAVKDACRDESRWNWFNQVLMDVRFGWRMMRKTPSITLAAVGSLALGIGATTSMLTLADAVLWRALPVPAPEQMLEIMWEAKKRPEGLFKGSSGSSFREGTLQVADFFGFTSYETMRSKGAGKVDVAAHVGSTLSSVSYKGQVAVTRVRGVTGNFFSVLQLTPDSGRLPGDSDDDAGAPPVVAVTHRFWSNRLAADPSAVGQPIRINNTSYTISGVLPRRFVGIAPGEETDLYVPLRQSPQLLMSDSWYRKGMSDSRSWWLQVIARRRAEVSTDEARALLDAAFASSWTAQPKSPEMTPHLRAVDASRGLGSLRRQFGNPVWMLLGLVGMVLLVACANIANLLLARAAEREKEVALRVSLGCGSARLLRQFLTESLMLAAIGGVLSLGVAVVVGSIMATMMPSSFDGMRLSNEVDLRSLAATAAITLLTALLFGLYPAWRTARVDAAPALKEGSGSGGTASRRRWLPAKVLVSVQVAFAVLLVSAAIIYGTQLNQIVSKDAGFERGHAVLFDVRPGEIGYEGPRLKQFYFELERRLGGLAGITHVGISRTRPMKGGGYFDNVKLPGSNKDPNAAIHHGNWAFMNALGVPLIAGRTATLTEGRTDTKVVVLSEGLVKELGLTSPLGARVIVNDKEHELIGVAKDARYGRLTQSDSIAYTPFDYESRSATVIVRTSIPPMLAVGPIRAAIREMDRDLPLVDIFSMEQQISRTLQRERMFAWLCGSFGVLALVLCVVGLYGLMSHTTARRTPEIGIRMALGASRGDVMRQVLLEGMRLAAIGLALGVPVAYYASTVAVQQRLLPEGTVPYGTMAIAIGVLAFAALAAVFTPAMRASAVDPLRALRG